VDYNQSTLRRSRDRLAGLRTTETIRRANRTLEVMKNTSHVDRLSEQIKELRARAERLPDGDERDELLRQVQQDEIARRLIEWVNSSDREAPDDVIPIWRHKLNRK
jgi:hypothetical protein